jgi:hypothetical protein
VTFLQTRKRLFISARSRPGRSVKCRNTAATKVWPGSVRIVLCVRTGIITREGGNRLTGRWRRPYRRLPLCGGYWPSGLSLGDSLHQSRTYSSFGDDGLSYVSGPRKKKKRKAPHPKTTHQLAGKKEGCIRRESNPSQLLGRQLSYRWTTEAITAKLENIAFLIRQYAPQPS